MIVAHSSTQERYLGSLTPLVQCVEWRGGEAAAGWPGFYPTNKALWPQATGGSCTESENFVNDQVIVTKTAMESGGRIKRQGKVCWPRIGH